MLLHGKFTEGRKSRYAFLVRRYLPLELAIKRFEIDGSHYEFFETRVESWDVQLSPHGGSQIEFRLRNRLEAGAFSALARELQPASGRIHHYEASDTDDCHES